MYNSPDAMSNDRADEYDPYNSIVCTVDDRISYWLDIAIGKIENAKRMTSDRWAQKLELKQTAEIMQVMIATIEVEEAKAKARNKVCPQ